MAIATLPAGLLGMSAYNKCYGIFIARKLTLRKSLKYLFIYSIIIEVSCWMYTSERQLARMRLAFIDSILHQDIEAFDTELTTAKIILCVTSHMSIIQDAIGEKASFFSKYSKTNIIGRRIFISPLRVFKLWFQNSLSF